MKMLEGAVEIKDHSTCKRSVIFKDQLYLSNMKKREKRLHQISRASVKCGTIPSGLSYV